MTPCHRSAGGGPVDAVVRPYAEPLGFWGQKKDLFKEYQRPLSGGSTGIIFEVERGKAVTNNMDLLDLWKCHICREASHLILVVPMVVAEEDGERTQSKRPCGHSALDVL